MNCSKLQELTAAHALNALNPADQAPLAARIAADPYAAAELASFQSAAAALALAHTPTLSPPPQLRDRILARVKSLQSPPRPAPPSTLPPGFQLVLQSATPWQPTPIPGFKFKLLSVSPDQGYQVLLTELAPGTSLPEHDHHASEQVYVLTGHLVTEGQTLGPGDLLHASPGTHHHTLISPDGCTALLIQKIPAPSNR